MPRKSKKESCFKEEKANSFNLDVICGVYVSYPKGELERIISEIFIASYPSSPRIRSIEMPCGETFTWDSKRDFCSDKENLTGFNDIPCSCGNPKHWFVKFQEIK